MLRSFARAIPAVDTQRPIAGISPKGAAASRPIASGWRHPPTSAPQRTPWMPPTTPPTGLQPLKDLGSDFVCRSAHLPALPDGKDLTFLADAGRRRQALRYLKTFDQQRPPDNGGAPIKPDDWASCARPTAAPLIAALEAALAMGQPWLWSWGRHRRRAARSASGCSNRGNFDQCLEWRVLQNRCRERHAGGDGRSRCGVCLLNYRQW